jgi:hypothetical protein
MVTSSTKIGSTAEGPRLTRIWVRLTALALSCTAEAHVFRSCGMTAARVYRWTATRGVQPT